MRPEGVVELDAERAEVAVLADVVRLCRVGIEDEGRLVLRARRVGEAAVSEKIPANRSAERPSSELVPAPNAWRQARLTNPFTSCWWSSMIPALESNGTANRVRERFNSSVTTSRCEGTYCSFPNPKKSVPSL